MSLRTAKPMVPPPDDGTAIQHGEVGTEFRTEPYSVPTEQHDRKRTAPVRDDRWGRVRREMLRRVFDTPE
jgi:hypothetical protein